MNRSKHWDIIRVTGQGILENLLQLAGQIMRLRAEVVSLENSPIEVNYGTVLIFPNGYVVEFDGFDLDKKIRWKIIEIRDNEGNETERNAN